MTKKRLFAITNFIVGIMLVFALPGCDLLNTDQPTWEKVDIAPITGTWSGNTITFTYEGSPGTLTRNGGGNTLDGVWEGTFDGDTVKVTINGGKWTMAVLDGGSYADYAKGTVTANGAALTIIVTHVMDYGSSYGESVGFPVEHQDSNYEGTWYGMRYLPGGEFHLKIVAGNGSFTQYLVIDYQDIANSRGTYKVSGNEVSLTITDSNKNTFDGGEVLWVAFDSLTTEEKLDIHFLTTATMNGTISGSGQSVSMKMGDNETVLYTRQPTGSGSSGGSNGSGSGESVGNPG